MNPAAFPPTDAVSYRGASVALLTRHGKQVLVTDPLERVLGCQVVHTDAYDTDLLGTFTREVPRPGSQLEAARRKARMGMAIVGTRIGLASEGAFGVDPFAGLLPWNSEILLWLDESRSLEVVGFAQGPARLVNAAVSTLGHLQEWAEQAGFPSHHLALRPDHPDHPAVRKGLDNAHSLSEAFAACLSEYRKGVVFVESDLRAFCNPTRQELIRQAANDLAARLASACPSCRSPGFWAGRPQPGLPCRSCGEPTRRPMATVWTCPACGYAQARPVQATHADPGSCDLCNP